MGSDISKDVKTGVRKTLLMGVFRRILAIEGILLVGTLLYEALSKNTGPVELAWYGLRIVALVAVIVIFMMITLKSFLDKKIITPLEAITAANRSLREDDSTARDIDLPENTPREIKEIVSSRMQMLNTILKVSEERLHYVNFIRDTFGRYLSKRVVDEILELPAGRKIGGRRETVTILLSDLRGFTSLSETRDPQEMVQLLNLYLERMSKIILQYNGMIDEFIGDAILAVFGAPEKGDDDPARAVACAIAMQNALLELNEEIADDGYPSLEMGIGINTGSVIVGNIGSEMRAKYGIVGAAVNIADRIQSNSVGGQVLVGESTYRQVSDLVTARPAQSAMMKGLKQPLVIYPIISIGPPYDLELKEREGEGNGVEIRLPFHYWKVDGKRIITEPLSGETLTINENFISASIMPPLEPLTDIKLRFVFCMDAHCFEDIYAKVLSIEEGQDKTANHLRITAISPEDKYILKKWISEAGGRWSEKTA